MTRFQLFSFDVVGSAAYKTARCMEDGIPGWLKAFHDFFDETPLVFTAEVARSFFDEEFDFPSVNLWKAIGDELVFISEPRSEIELSLLTQSFIRAVRLVNDRLKSKWGLEVHGVCWSFEEGGRNQMIRFRELENNDAKVLDFIGPDVDLGFRLATYARAGRVLTSLEHSQRLLHNILVQEIGHKILKGISVSSYPLLEISLSETTIL